MKHSTQNRRHHWALAALILSVFALPETAHARSGLGVNINAANYWGTELKFANVMKAASGPFGIWMTRCDPNSNNQVERDGCRNFRAYPNGWGTFAAWDTGEQSKLNLDPYGYPLSLPAPNDTSVKYRAVGAIVIHPDSKSDSGEYIILYDGEGTLAYSGVTKVGSVPGRDVVKYTAGNEFNLTITATNPNNYIRNIRVIPPGGACSNEPDNFAPTAAECTGTFTPMEDHAKTHVFHPRFVAGLKGMRILRFMDTMCANCTDKDSSTGDPRHTLVAWSDRARREDVSYTQYEGLPFPVLFDLADEVGADPWINIGYRVQDSVAINFGKLAKSRLQPGQTLYLEYGNEPWNGAFPNSSWLAAQGKATFPDCKAGESGACCRASEDSECSDWSKQLNYYSLRASQICQLVKAQFGADSSAVKCVMGGWAASAWTNEHMLLKCPVADDVLGKSCDQVFDAIAIAPYFGGEIGNVDSDGNGKDPAPYFDRHGRTVMQWLGDPDGGLGALFEELEYVSLPESINWTRQNKAVADKYGKFLLGYEGGQHLLDFAEKKVQGGEEVWFYHPAVRALFQKANSDPRMGSLYTRYLTQWKDVGPQTMVLFTNIAADGSYGYWGLRQDIQQVSTPKWDAARSFRDNVSCWWDGC